MSKQGAATVSTAKERYETAFVALASVLAAGGLPRLDRGKVAVVYPGPRPVAADGWEGILNDSGGEAKEFVSGGRKDWAKGRKEAVLAFDMQGDKIQEVGVVRLEDRRVLTSGALFRVTEPGGRTNLAAFLADIDGLVVADVTARHRAALGILLGDIDVGRGKLEITEVSVGESPDYRNFLAGSGWFDMPKKAVSGAVAQALLVSLQVRSLRQSGLKTARQSWYTAMGVHHLGKTGATEAQIQKRLRLPEHLVKRWMRSPEESAARAATPAQLSFVRDILGDIPELDVCLPRAWEEKGEAVSAFLTKVKEHHHAWRKRRKELTLAQEVRRRVGTGEALGIVATVMDIPRDKVIASMEEDLRVGLRRLGDEMSAALDCQVRLETPAD